MASLYFSFLFGFIIRLNVLLFQPCLSLFVHVDSGRNRGEREREGEGKRKKERERERESKRPELLRQLSILILVFKRFAIQTYSRWNCLVIRWPRSCTQNSPSPSPSTPEPPSPCTPPSPLRLKCERTLFSIRVWRGIWNVLELVSIVRVEYFVRVKGNSSTNNLIELTRLVYNHNKMGCVVLFGHYTMHPVLLLDSFDMMNQQLTPLLHFSQTFLGFSS